MDSSPMNSALHPLLAASSRNSSSKATSSVAWLVHHLPNGAIARNNSLAYLRLAPMLSSQNTSALPGIRLTSSPPHLRNPLADRTVAHLALIHRRNRAIVAGKRAAPGCNGDAFPIDTPLDQVPARRRHPLPIRQSRTAIHRRQPSLLTVLKYPWPNKFAFTHHDSIGMSRHFVGQQRRVRTAYHHRDASFAILFP